MSWNHQIDIYCERTDFTFWSEPVNAITNAAFLIAAVYVFPMTKGIVLGRILAVLLFLIGLGSFAFHTTATQWGSAADVTPIVLFIFVYIFAITRDGFGAKWWVAGLAVIGFFPFAALTVPVFEKLGMGGSSAYGPVPLLIFIYAAVLWRKHPQLARGMAIGAGILCLSLAMRMIDEPICQTLPLGTHFLWHIFNAIMLGHMIRVYCRHYSSHMLEGRPEPR